MKILWVKAGKLLPVDTGGKIRSYNILVRLAERNEITLLSHYGGDPDPAYDREINELLPGTRIVHTGVHDASAVERAFAYVRRIPSPYPFAVSKFTAPTTQDLISQWLNERRFDVAVCDFLGSTLNFPRKSPTPVVLFQHNVETMLWKRHSEHETNPLKKLAFKIEANKMTRYERKAVSWFDHVIAVSEFDRDLMKAMTDESRITVVPTGVDIAQYQAAAGESATEPVVIFLGSMDWEANVDGMLYYCREIWPLIKKAVPQARFRIVGRNPDARIKQLAADDIEITGRVPSVFEHIRQAAVFVVPLRIGGGTRLKIFEAMAMRKAVVSTTIGAEGLDVNHGRDILLADDPKSFADAVIDLLQNPTRRARFEQAAGEQAARYDWSVVTEQFEEVLRSTIAKQKLPVPSMNGALPIAQP